MIVYVFIGIVVIVMSFIFGYVCSDNAMKDVNEINVKVLKLKEEIIESQNRIIASLEAEIEAFKSSVEPIIKESDESTGND